MRINKLLPLFLVLLLGFVVSSCEDDDRDQLVDRLVHSEWEADLYKIDANSPKDLYSVFTFNYDGTGLEYMYYDTNDMLHSKTYFRWRFRNDGYGEAIELSYRSHNEFFDDIRFRGNRMWVIHYENNYDFDYKKHGHEIIFEEFYPRELYD